MRAVILQECILQIILSLINLWFQIISVILWLKLWNNLWFKWVYWFNLLTGNTERRRSLQNASCSVYLKKSAENSIKRNCFRVFHIKKRRWKTMIFRQLNNLCMPSSRLVASELGLLNLLKKRCLPGQQRNGLDWLVQKIPPPPEVNYDSFGSSVKLFFQILKQVSNDSIELWIVKTIFFLQISSGGSNIFILC